MEQVELFYQESGKINPLRFVMAFISCIIITFILGYVYSIITVIMPIIYFNILFTLGFSFLLIWLAKLFIRIAHIRNKKVRIIFTFAIGFLACYFQWTTYITFAIIGEVPNAGIYLSHFYLFLNPVTFFTLIAEMIRVGMWSIFGEVFNGAGLAVVWIIEAVLIMGIPVFAITNSMPVPYSELLGKWYKKFILKYDFEYFFSTKDIISDLKNNPLQTLQNLGKGSGNQHVKIYLFYLKDEERDYLSFESVSYSGSKKNKRNSTFLINNFTITKSDADLIMLNFKHKIKNDDY